MKLLMEQWKKYLAEADVIRSPLIVYCPQKKWDTEKTMIARVKNARKK